MRCFQCKNDNPKQAFCGTCGSPLELDVFIASRVRIELGQQTKERDLVERESAVRIFEKVTGWARTFAWVFTILILPLAAVGIYKWSDLYSTINAAKKSVTELQAEVVRTAGDKEKTIEATAAEAQHNVNSISSDATRVGRDVVNAAVAAKAQISEQTAAVQNDIDGLRKEIGSASTLQPELTSIREELARQQKQFSSSESFAKSVFSSHRVEFFDPGQPPSARYRILPRKTGQGATVYLLLDKPPVAETLQLQYHVFAQPRNSFFSIHNLVIFNWGDPAPSLTKQVSISYFPDPSDKEVIKTLSDKDGRIYADGEPLLRVGEPDAGFTGNKWLRAATNN